MVVRVVCVLVVVMAMVVVVVARLANALLDVLHLLAGWLVGWLVGRTRSSASRRRVGTAARSEGVRAEHDGDLLCAVQQAVAGPSQDAQAVAAHE